MGRLAGRVAIVTGAGRGLGRAHALELAKHGAKVVVNDLGVETDGSGGGLSPALEVVEAIRASGGEAVANGDDVSDWQGAGALISAAVEAFGDLHVLVNNAGILRDRTLGKMSEEEWDAVIRVHLKGHAATSHHALAHWRERAKAGPVKASIVHTSSIAAYLGNFGQANYAAAKLGIVALSRVIQLEGEKIGVRSNAISPSARTRMMGGAAPEPGAGFDMRDPANVSPLVAWLALADCPASGQYYQVYGSRLLVLTMPQIAHDLMNPRGRWTLEDLDEALRDKLIRTPDVNELLADLRGRQVAAP